MTADTITAIKKAFPNMFRPLEWHHFDGKTEHGHGEWWAHGSRGMFHIYDVREKFPDDRPFYAKELSDQLDTLEMAQEAVQKRHEMDIVMCLDPEFLSTLESLQRENEELRDALKPFADYMGDHGDKDNLGNPLPGNQDVAWVYLTYADFRRARAALSSTGDTHGN